MVEVAAVDGTDLGGEHDGVDEGEQGSGGVKGQLDHVDLEGGDEAGHEAVDGGDPGEHGDEQGEVDGGGGGAGGVDGAGYDVADEGGDEETEEELEAAVGRLQDAELHFLVARMDLSPGVGGVSWRLRLCFVCLVKLEEARLSGLRLRLRNQEQIE